MSFSDLKPMLRQQLREVIYTIRDMDVVWRSLLNRRAGKLYRAHRPTFSLTQQRVLRELQAVGISEVPFAELFGNDPLLRDIQTVFDERLASASRNPRKDFLLDPRNAEHFALDGHDPFFRFATDPRVLNIVNGYMEMWSQLHDIVINQTQPLEPGESKGRSQLWHRDSHDVRVCKVFVYLNDVDETGGPFCYVRKSQKGARWWSLYPQHRPSGNYPALEGVEERLPAADTRTYVGKAGTILFCDTIGIHKGGYATTGTRKMLTCSFFSSAHTSSRRHYTLPKNVDGFRDALAPEAQFAITVPVGTKPRFAF